MTRPGPALLAYDGSSSSATAIAVAGQLLRGREAVVCHVWSGVSQVVFHTTPAELPGVLSDAALELDELDSEAAEKVVDDGVKLARSAGFDARPLTVRRATKTWRALIDAAEEISASALVCGSHGSSGVGRVLLGTVSTALVHHASTPVLVVPGATTTGALTGPPLLCYDGSEGARRAISSAADLLAARRVLVAHFWESWVAEAPALAGVSGTVQGMATELDEIADERSGKFTKEGVDVAETAGFDASGVSQRATGPTWRAVLDAADDHACAAIVIGARGLTGISAALGSVSNGVVHHSRRPVLVVPPRKEEE
jgi:nucleotide-binding universal stress UspA family protein